MAAGDPILAADYAGIRLGTIDRPTVKLAVTGTQALASGGTAIQFTAETWDPYNFHDNAVNTSRITPTKAGYYTFIGGVYFASSATVEAVWLKQNGTTTFPSGQREGTPSAATQRGLLVHGSLWMNGTTDYVEMFGDPGAAINTNQSSHFSSFLECWHQGRATNP